MLGHLYWFHSWGCYLSCISKTYLINWFVVHWFPSDGRGFVMDWGLRVAHMIAREVAAYNFRWAWLSLGMGSLQES